MNTYVKIATDHGSVLIKLYDETPLHRDNFVKLVKEGKYEGLLFHRVIKEFMIQGGDPLSKEARPNQMLGSGDIGYKVPQEIMPSLFHKRGALAAARDNNPMKSSSGIQFYIVQGKKYSDDELARFEKSSNAQFTTDQRDTYIQDGGVPFLDGNYTVFGEVVKGIEMVDAITQVGIDRNDRPLKDVKMSVTLLSNDEAAELENTLAN